MSALISATALTLCASLACGAVVSIDPARGETLADRISSLKPGDTAVLASGHHGVISISGRDNDPAILITAGEGQIPTLGKLSVTASSGWTFRGLTISPSLAGLATRTQIVSLGSRRGGPSSKLIIEDCFIYSVLDTTSWTIDDWNKLPGNGLDLDRSGTGLIARNNHILNTNFAMNLAAPGSIVEGNVIENFSGDGIRVTVDDLTVRNNVIRNNYNVNDNHDDGIQAFLFHKGTGTVSRAHILKNIIIERDDPNITFKGPLQGLGFFDGPLVNFEVDGNVIDVSAWHGIALYDAQGCTVTGNTVFDSKAGKSWITIDGKKKQQRDNTVTGNYSGTYRIKSPGLTDGDNQKISETIYISARDLLRKDIDNTFGPTLPLSGYPRFGKAGNGLTVTGYHRYVPGAKPEAKLTSSNKATKAPLRMSLQPIPEAFDRFDKQLHELVANSLNGPRHPRFRAQMFGGKEAEITAIDGNHLTLEQGGSELSMPIWATLTPNEKADIAKGLVREANTNDHALVAFFLLAAGEPSQAQTHLALAGLNAEDFQTASFTSKSP